jgi:hypothetical protein
MSNGEISTVQPAPKSAEPKPQVNQFSLRRVRVLGLDKSPVADAELSWEAQEFDRGARAKTDLLGYAEMQLVPGQRLITVFKEGAGIAEQALEFSAEKDGALEDLFLIRPAVIHGKVQRADGRPVPGAKISAMIRSALTGSKHLIPSAEYVLADERGCFEMLLDSRCGFRIQACHGG